MFGVISFHFLPRKRIPDFCFPDGRPKRRTRKRRRVNQNVSAAKIPALDSPNPSTELADATAQPQNGTASSDPQNSTETDANGSEVNENAMETEKEEAEVVEIPQVPELQEIEGDTDGWQASAQPQTLTKKPKVTLMTRKI